MAAGCGPAGPTGSGPTGGSASPNGAPSDTALLPSDSPAPSDSPSPEPTASEQPTESGSPAPTDTPGPSPSSSGSAGPSDACYGSSDTRGFFLAFAQAVSWPVYCAVLPTGWSVEKGTYRLKDGGRLTISYRRRADGARIVLDEGALCLDGTGCRPTGTDAGTTSFGDRDADLVATTTGFGASVDGGQNPSWLLTGTTISGADFRTIAAALFLVDQ